VANGLALVREDAELIGIHDAARPCTSEDMIDAVFAEAAKSGAAVLAAPLRGTIKRVSDAGIVDETVSREGLWEAQTPQVFRRDVILGAYEKRGELPGPVTDDAQVVEAAGHAVSVVESDFTNLKVTAKADTGLAASIIKMRPAKPKGPLRPFEEAQW
jgi:2-C-methyl-D-erythritol 4-phosphate cytidylyltransferase